MELLPSVAIRSVPSPRSIAGVSSSHHACCWVNGCQMWSRSSCAWSSGIPQPTLVPAPAAIRVSNLRKRVRNVRLRTDLYTDTCKHSAMAELGAPPKVPRLRRKALHAVRSLFTPLLPDDYLELINPLWSTRELRGRIERIDRETPEAATVLIRPGFEWTGHQPGQYLRIGVVVDGGHHWRASSLTSEPDRADGCISITPKLVEAGKVSPYFVRGARPGDVVRLGGVEGTFVLPDPLPPKLLFLSAGSGITPIMSMLRSLHRADTLADAVHLPSARSAEGAIFADLLHRLDAAHEGYSLHLRLTGEQGRIAPGDPAPTCPPPGARAAGGRPRAAPEGALPAGDGRGGRRGGGWQGALRSQPGGDSLRERHADPRRRRGGRGDAALWLPDGHLPHLRRQALQGPGARPAHRPGPRQRGGDDQDMCQRTRGTDRDRALKIQEREI